MNAGVIREFDKFFGEAVEECRQNVAMF